ncbi:MAG: RagB/SusD family nutrient uptake outer membrane protein [bacterium]
MTNSSRTLRTTLVIAIASALLVTACDLKVTNPGPIADEQLSSVTAIPALVNGMSGDLSLALGRYIDRGALGSGELTEAGLFIPEGHYYLGQFVPQDVNADWGNMQTARWTAESGLVRMKAVLGAGFDANVNTPRAYLYGGFANRLLGENVCTSVIDGGPAGSDSVYFTRAESLFTRAFTLATALNNTSIATAALGGRASVRAWLGNWTGAVADALLVPTAYNFNAVFSTNTARENNDLVNQTLTRSETSVFGTVYAANNKEPRATWDTVKTGTAITKGANGTAIFRQTKYKTLAAPVSLTKGTEMLLLRAEAALRAGDVTNAMLLINAERTTFALAPLAATTTAAAWTALQSERGLLLWLEGRRLWDLRRWFAEGTNTFLTGRDKCLPVSADEAASNSNLH